MPPADPAILILLQIAVLALPAALLAWILRQSQIPGGNTAAALVAGISIGLIAGPGVLGRARPNLHDALFRGGVAEAGALRQQQQRHAEEMLALRASSVTETAILEHKAQQEQSLAPLIEKLNEAQAKHTAALHWLTQGCFALYLTLAGSMLVPGTSRSFTRLARSLLSVPASSIGVGLITTALACAIPALLTLWLAKCGISAAIAVGIILGAPGIAASMRAGPYIAAAFGLFMAMAAALILAWSPGMTIIGAGLLLGLLLLLGIEGSRSRAIRTMLARLALIIALPTAIALLVVQVDLLADAARHPRLFWVSIILSLLWSSDGRWAIAWVAWKQIGPPQSRPVALACATQMLNAGTGIAQVGFTMAFLATGVIHPAMLSGLILGAVLIELTRGARNWLTFQLDARR